MKRLLILTVLLAGCGSKEAALKGTWNGVIDAGAQSGNPVAQAMLKGLGSPVLTLTDDKRFTLQLLGENKGTWTFAENKLTLKPEAVGGSAVGDMREQVRAQALQAIGQGFVFTLSDDGKTLSADKTRYKMTFTKAG